MIYSMTGYGRAELADRSKKINIELKSVNHRYLDFNIRMPKKLNAIEGDLRIALKQYAKRGKVDVFVNYENYADESADLVYNEVLAGSLVAYAKQLSDTFHLQNDFSVSKLMSFSDVLSARPSEVDEDALKKELLSLLDQAGRAFSEARAQEGERLKEDLLSKLSEMDCLVDEIKKREPEILAAYQKRLTERVQELLSDAQADESRITAEVVLYADKISTDEETVRLQSHIHAMRNELQNGGEIGRKLDFIAQEMNREANTILSKANDILTSGIGIELKTVIEKIREQIQNLE